MKKEPLSFYTRCPGDIKPIWFMLVEEGDGFYLKEEYEEAEHHPFLITRCAVDSPVLELFKHRKDALKEALRIIRIIRPQAQTTDLEDEIAVYEDQ